MAARQSRNDGGLGDVEELRGFGDVESAEEAALDEHGLARLEAGQVVERLIEREQVVGASTRPPAAHSSNVTTTAPPPRFVERRRRAASTRTWRMARAAMRLKWRREVRATPGRLAQLEPGLVHECGWAQRGVRIVAPDGGGKAAQLLVGGAEKIVERASVVDSGRTSVPCVGPVSQAAPSIMTVREDFLRNGKGGSCSVKG